LRKNKKSARKKKNRAEKLIFAGKHFLENSGIVIYMMPQCQY